MTTSPRAKRTRFAAFVEKVAAEGAARYRDFPWRGTCDPYEVLVSEVMLQQTQVSRVVPYYERWLAAFPTLEALASAPLEAVLREWRGLGYNRRAVALKRAAETLVSTHSAEGAVGSVCVPSEEAALRALPGIGPATAAGVRAFAFGEPAAYLETNVRTVFLHELFADRDGVTDGEIAPLVQEAATAAASAGIDARTWNYALLDYGAYLKRVMPNPSRRSAHHARQSPFPGSRREKRSLVLRAVMDEPGVTSDEIADALGLEPGITTGLLEELAAEGFVTRAGDGWIVA